MTRTIGEALAHAEDERFWPESDEHLVGDFILLADEVKRLRELINENYAPGYVTPEGLPEARFIGRTLNGTRYTPEIEETIKASLKT